MKIEIVKTNLNTNQIKNSVANLVKIKKLFTEEEIKRKMKKLNKEILQERSNKIHNFNYEIIGDYVNNYTKIKILHKVCGNIFEQQPNNHLQGKGCMKCSGRDNVDVEKLQEKSNKKYNGDYLIIDKYVNNITNIKIKHLICETEFLTTPVNHLKSKGCCTKCYKNNKKTKEQLQKESDKIHNKEYIIIGDYVNTDTKIEIKHLTCGNNFKQTPDKHLRNNRCPICFGKNKLSKEILQERSDKKYNNEYTILGEYINNSTPILIKHNICGSEYLQIPNNHIKGNRTCFKCRGNMSNGEKLILNYLELKNIKYVFNNTIKGCNFNKPLRFDFYLPDMNTCLEYDGEQHFKSISKFGGDDHLILTKKRDNIKNIWCDKNKINLIRISYKDNIENKLNEIFNIY